MTKDQQTICRAAYTWHTQESAVETMSPCARPQRRMDSGFSRPRGKQRRRVPIEVTYPGTGNYSQLTFDAIGRNVRIVEVSAGSTTGTKQFVWCDNDRCEERDASGNLVRQFFSRGEIIAGTNAFYTTDHLGAYLNADVFSQLPEVIRLTQPFNGVAKLGRSNSAPSNQSGSVRDLIDGSGNVLAQYAYDPFGKTTRLQGSQESDFRYAGYYSHSRSGLNLTMMRAYSSAYGRWLSRDPLGEDSGLNLYAYVSNQPITLTDPTGAGPDGGGTNKGCQPCAADTPDKSPSRWAICSIYCGRQCQRAYRYCLEFLMLPKWVCRAYASARFTGCMTRCLIFGPGPDE